jgi:3-oxoacyl-[acyl-carrier protein] reductase
VNAVAPGFIDTDMTSQLGDKFREKARGTIPLGRFGTADEVAHAVLFLLSDASQYITGQVLQIDGGMGM